jgi:membrane protein
MAPDGPATPPEGTRWSLPAGWGPVLDRARQRLRADNAVLMAAGVAFFGLLALFPPAIAVVSIYGLLADPSDVTDQVERVASGLPESTQQFLIDELDRIVASSSGGLGLTLGISVVDARWSASSGVRHLMESIDVAYAAPPHGFVALRAKALAVAVAGILVLVLLVAVLTVVPSLTEDLGQAHTVALVLRWPVVGLVMLAVLAVLYRVAPNRDGRLRWTSPGSVVATACWLVASAALALYAARFASFQATYGSIVAVIATMLWLFLGALSVLIGAYVNREVDVALGAVDERGAMVRTR